jgi:hypothetical protein
MDSVQNCDSYISMPSSKTYGSYPQIDSHDCAAWKRYYMTIFGSEMDVHNSLELLQWRFQLLI